MFTVSKTEIQRREAEWKKARSKPLENTPKPR
jgi:hypothetical protein